MSDATPHRDYPKAKAASDHLEGTRLESVEEIRQAMKSRRNPTQKEAAETETPAFRPLRRPPMALLCILDDGREEGEWYRLRSERTVLGRSEGDIVIPHDTMMSSRHAEILRKLELGRYVWYLADLRSTNGTYVRVGNALLKHNQEMLIGGRRYRFESGAAPLEPPADATAHEGDSQLVQTRGWQAVQPSDFIPSLVELTTQGDGQRYLLQKPDNLMGRDARVCNVLVHNDPLLSPRHAVFHRDKKGRWHVENARSINGVWLRVDQIVLDNACQFQLGEQRFLVRLLS